ncbi:MAG TPA: hypothetical protein VLV84_00695 [Candidatus Acidoferrales bacterium]|nr:hypothetical protein [Candidatus Acidoferrales bacterium]
MENKREELASLAAKKGVEARFHEKTSFTKFINLKGDSKLKEGFQHCRERMVCPMLKQGTIYYCFLPAVINAFDKHFGEAVPSSGFVRIHEMDITGLKLSKMLSAPSQTCKYCTGGWAKLPSSPWRLSKRKITEWIAV